MTATLTQQAVSTWQIDASHTTAQFAVKHMFSTVKGAFSDVTGTITIDEDQPKRSHVEVQIATASIDTRDAKRDAHLRSDDFFGSETWPAMTFVSTYVEPLGRGRFAVTGDLTIRNVTQPVVLQVEETGRGTSPWGTEVIGFEAVTEINRKDFGLTWNVALEAGGFLVGDKVKITLDVEATKQ